MTRWKEIDGKYIDLDEVRAIALEYRGSSAYSSYAVAALTLPGGAVDVPLRVSVIDTNVRFPDRPPRRRLAERLWPPAVRRYRARDREYVRERDAASLEYGAACDRDRLEVSRLQRAAFDALVCEIGARDCDPNE